MRRSYAFVALLATLSASVTGFAAESVSPQALVRSALHAEVHGLADRRDALLHQSLASPLVQSYLGKIQQGGDWRSLEESAQQLKDDAALAEYQAQRDKLRDDYAGNVALADWCSNNRLPDQAEAHLLRALDFQPDDRALRNRLGHVLSGREWFAPEEIAQQQRRFAEQTAANEKWITIVSDLSVRLTGKGPVAKSTAAEELKQIDDPLAIPVLEAAFAARGDQTTLLLLEVLSGISDPRASESLARLAVMSNSPVVREDAAQRLGQRDPHSYIPQLLAAMRGPVQTRAGITIEPDGRLLYRHQFSREGQERHDATVVDVRINRVPRFGGSQQLTLADALRQARREALRREWLAQLQTLSDQQLNERIAAALRTATGAKQPSSPESWWKWWEQENEAFNEGSKPYQVAYVSNTATVVDQVPVSPRCECFVAGTPVWTSRGEQDIEKLKVGDLVLSQNLESGALEYKTIVRTTQRGATKLVRLTIASDVLDCTGGHLFWVVGEGWTKARDLKAGQTVHGAQGSAIVTATEEGDTLPTYNLVVDDNHNYFVGLTRCLTHDNTPRRANQLVAPGVGVEE